MFRKVRKKNIPHIDETLHGERFAYRVAHNKLCDFVFLLLRVFFCFLKILVKVLIGATNDIAVIFGPYLCVACECAISMDSMMLNFIALPSLECHIQLNDKRDDL